MLTEEENVASIWVADVSETVLRDYVAEDDSISRFAKDIGKGFEDHDAIEETWQETPVPLADLIRQFSYGEVFGNEAVEAAKALKLGDRFNAITIMYDRRFKGKWPANAPLKFLGTFSYEEPEPPAPELQPGDHSGRIHIARVIGSNLVATAGGNGEVRFWDPTAATAIATRSRHSDSFVQALCVSTDGTALYSSSNEVLHWDLRKTPIRSRKIGEHGGFQIEDVALLADQGTIAAACVDKTVGLIDVQSGKSNG
jgi:hypothetical protein